MSSGELRRTVIGIAIVVIAAASGFFYVGPYRWIAELQMAALGWYSAKLTFVVTVLALAIPVVLGRRILERQEVGPDAERDDAHPVLGRIVAAFTASPRAARAILFGVAFAGTGSFLALRDLAAGPLTQLDVAALERGEEPRSRYVDLAGGELRVDRALFVDGLERSYYVPYAARTGAAVVVVELREREVERAVDGPLRGTLERDGLPGPVRVDLEELGDIEATHWLLRLERGRDGALVALAIAGIGWVLLSIGAIVVYVGRPRASAA